MSIEVKVPVFPESVTDGTLVRWYKKPGDAVKRGENLADIETDKVVFDLPALDDGVLEEVLEEEGATVVSGQLIARIKSGAVAEPARQQAEESMAEASGSDVVLSPSARRLVAEHGLKTEEIPASGKGGRVLKEDVLRVLEKKKETSAPQAAEPAPADAAASPPAAERREPPSAAPIPAPTLAERPAVEAVATMAGDRPEKRVPMTRLRARIAERLVEAQHTAAILTTFNEINMQPVIELRKRYRERFEKEHGVKLGFMSFFVKACVEALKRFPEVNASIEAQDIVYHGFYDIGIAVSSPRGLVVPIVRDADQLSMADIEKQIKTFGDKAATGTLSIDDITGGTFSISNGGVFGSMLSTPILNPPQSAILGMHRTQERPVVESGQIVIRPIMYVALSYDHRIIDGREAVQFLVTIKESLEDPARIILGI